MFSIQTFISVCLESIIKLVFQTWIFIDSLFEEFVHSFAAVAQNTIHQIECLSGITSDCSTLRYTVSKVKSYIAWFIDICSICLSLINLIFMEIRWRLCCIFDFIIEFAIFNDVLGRVEILVKFCYYYRLKNNRITIIVTIQKSPI